jgi:hypothetical protein
VNFVAASTIGVPMAPQRASVSGYVGTPRSTNQCRLAGAA